MIPGKLIFKAIVGSQAHGTATPESDIDIKGVYLQPNNDLLSFNYIPFYKVSKDEIYYELNRFVELLNEANPDALELLKCEETVLLIEPEFQILKDTYKLFITKKCKNTFGNYARSQIQKATARDKKVNWEKERFERKSVLDFCYFVDKQDGKQYKINDWLKKEGYSQEIIGLAKIDHFRDTYKVYLDLIKWSGEFKPNHRFDNIDFSYRGYRGIIGDENCNEPRLSEIEQYMTQLWYGILYFNREQYSIHCREYKEYQKWLKDRNEIRFNVNQEHKQKYDSKNISHCYRLTTIAREIAETGDFKLVRSDKDFLLQIKNGEVDLKVILDQVNNTLDNLDLIYEKSNLPNEADLDKIKELILQIRNGK